MEDFNDLHIEEEPAPQHQGNPLGVFGMLFTKMTTDMKFVGMFTIVYGVLTSLSIIGAIIGVPLIFAGLRIREAADEFNAFRLTNDNVSLKRGFELQGKYFYIQKIIIIVGLVLFALYLIGIIIFGITMFSSYSQY
ncbi:MAG: DUF5362 domain-containing protein [Bacteroidota bacterium]